MRLKSTFTRFLQASKCSRSNKYSRKPLDSILEYFRFTKVDPYIPTDAYLLDVGSGDGNFLSYLDGHIEFAVGIDSHLPESVSFGACRLISGYFPSDFETDITFDVITMMAVVEHIPMDVLPSVSQACWKYLKPGGHVIITVQHPRVEKLLDFLKILRIVDGFSMHEHYGFDPECLKDIFGCWKLIKRERWGFGCNNLFIFEK